MKFRCPCGHVVTDSGVEDDHHKGRILRAQSLAKTCEDPAEKVAEFIRAVREGKRKEWIDKFYGGGSGGPDIADSAVVFDIFDLAHLTHSLSVFQCDKCGRIFIDRKPRSYCFRSFKPEDEDWQETLADG